MKLERKLRRYLRKKHLRDRYGWESDKSVDRATKDGRLPPPDTYNGRFPLWSEETLDAHDAARREQAIAPPSARTGLWAAVRWGAPSVRSTSVTGIR
jgi:hypothetical protein